jgi:anti-sigma factor RsiW
MMDENGHPDEGTIHAWLDGALSADDATALEVHVAACVTCAERVAEARGLIAGASRVVSELDEAPVPILRAAGRAEAPAPSFWRLLRITPARASIAALLLVAVGVTMTTRQTRQAQKAAAVPDTVMGMQAPSARTVEQPKEPGVVVPPTGTVATVKTALADSNAGNQVAAARMSVEATRDTTSSRADHALVGRVAGAPVAEDRDFRARKAALNEVVAATSAPAAAPAPPTVVGCYRVEAMTGATGKWGDVALPFVLVMDSTGTTARVLTTGGTDTEARATVTKSDADSLKFQLRRIGFVGTLSFGGAGPTRQGFAQSVRAPVTETSVTVTTRSVNCPVR